MKNIQKKRVLPRAGRSVGAYGRKNQLVGAPFFPFRFVLGAALV
jgi:hypothetical protein